ncbi:hypothetical protein XELAEV_18000020mg [Xenopus laevis]|uniref:L1 transposable element RRM domain-containing protein n=1 Tax=Xenopus laevis TaxID=8355 RepID=A0A974BQX4_XENLA|nr:hypothetical protein XELAEV_18000020mg [Xenopus laevis]
MASQRTRRTRSTRNTGTPKQTRSVAELLAKSRRSVSSPSPAVMDSQPSIFDSQSSEPLTQIHQTHSSDEVLLGKFKLLLQSELELTATRISTDLTKQVADLGQRIAETESKMDDCITVLDSHEQDIITMQSQLKDVQDRIEDSDNRSRRNNIRIRGLPESISDLRVAILELLQTLAPVLPVKRLEMDRVAILAAARAKGKLIFQTYPYQVYADLSPTTLQRRRNLGPLTAILQQRKILYRWLFPFRLLFTHNNRQHSIVSLEEGRDLFVQLGFGDATLKDIPNSANPSRKLSPIWEKVRSLSQKSLASSLSGHGLRSST